MLDIGELIKAIADIHQSYGFSDKVGLVAHGDDESVYLSGKKKDQIEGEIRRSANSFIGSVPR